MQVMTQLCQLLTGVFKLLQLLLCGRDLAFRSLQGLLSFPQEGVAFHSTGCVLLCEGSFE